MGFCMSRHAAAMGVLLLSVFSLPAQEGGKKLDQGDALFGLAKVHKFNLELTPADWKKMQPPPGMKFPGFGPKQPAPKDPKDAPADVHKSAGAFGTEFPWVKADFSADGKTIKNVGVRFKGNFTYIA